MGRRDRARAGGPGGRRGGHALAGGVRDAGAGKVARRLAEVRGPLRAGTKVAFDARVWEGDPRSARGIPFRGVQAAGLPTLLTAYRNALNLDAPVLDWRSVIDLQAAERGLPGFLATTVEWTVSARIGFDWDAFDQVARAREFRMPILLFHGTQDTTVPVSSSDAFARALPRRVTYHRVPGAGHVEAWNVDPAVYGRRVRAFLDRVGA